MNISLKSFLFLFSLIFYTTLSADGSQVRGVHQAVEKPLIERYIIDELKDLRMENMKLKTEVERRISRAEVEQTDRAARYMTDTIGNVFYLIAAATSILIFAGWNSLRDIRRKTEEIVESRLDDITKKYNAQMQALQDTLTQQSKKILDNQNKIYNTQYLHSLWMRSNLETNPQSKIDIYDEILKVNSNDAEVYAYKADAWRAADFKICYLSKQQRYIDDEYVDVLNNIRNSKVDDQTVKTLESRLNREVLGIVKPIRLYTRNINVDSFNNIELDNLKTNKASSNLELLQISSLCNFEVQGKLFFLLLF